MRVSLSFAVLAVVAGMACAAQAGTMYKCADAQGKIAFSDQPCNNSAKELKTFNASPSVQGPEDAVRALQQSEKLKQAELDFQGRKERSDRAYAERERMDAQHRAMNRSTAPNQENAANLDDYRRRAAIRSRACHQRNSRVPCN